MASKEAYVYDVFQRVAPGYDRANKRISAGQHLRWKREAVRMMAEGLPESPKLLDIGCGTGDMLLLQAEACPSAQITGLDFSPNMLEVARERVGNNPQVELVQGNALALPFEDDSFDGATFAFALRNTADYAQALSEALRVLRPGGALVVIDSFVPENPLVRPFYQLYFSVFMPLVGGGLRGWKQYRWLARSTAQFVSASELMALMRRVGYGEPSRRSFMLGACSCVRGRKVR